MHLDSCKYCHKVKGAAGSGLNRFGMLNSKGVVNHTTGKLSKLKYLLIRIGALKSTQVISSVKGKAIKCHRAWISDQFSSILLKLSKCISTATYPKMQQFHFMHQVLSVVFFQMSNTKIILMVLKIWSASCPYNPLYTFKIKIDIKMKVCQYLAYSTEIHSSTIKQADFQGSNVNEWFPETCTEPQSHGWYTDIKSKLVWMCRQSRASSDTASCMPLCKCCTTPRTHHYT